MWVLSHIKTGRRFYLLTNTKKYTVGRAQHNDLSLSDDASVSRDHAVIHRSSSGVRIEDNSSKYGSYINGGIDTNRGIAPKTPVELQPGNIVRFGRMENTFRLEKIPLNVCTSTMGPEDINKLRKQLKLIDGEFRQDWSTQCTHLVMSNVTVTIKVLQSLAYGVPIVSPEYFDKYIESATNNALALPDVKDFVPAITEPYIIKEPGMMEVHLDRQRLFQNKTFVFMVNHHMQKFDPIIQLAAGKSISMETEKVKKPFLLKSDYIPVNYQPSANTQCSSHVEGIVQYIESHGRRLVNDTEIGLAIIHRGIDRFCNPDRKMVNDFEPDQVNTFEIIGNVLAQETPKPPTNPNIPHQSSTIVPETIELTGSEPNNNRCSEVIDLDKPSTSSARRATRSSTKGSNESTNLGGTKALTPTKNAAKRRHDEEIGQGPNDADEMKEGEKSEPGKKQKIDNAAKNNGESSSAHFIEPMPPQSQDDHNFSGFISTQNRAGRRKATQDASATQPSAPTPGPSKITRKRVLGMLTANSDEEQDEDDDDIFGKVNRKPKRNKMAKEPHTSARNTLNMIDDDNDDEDDNLFGFSKKPKRSQKRNFSPQKVTQKKTDEVDAPVIPESQSSYKRPFQRTQNRSLNRSVIPVEIIPVPTCDTEWISLKMKKELNLNKSNSDTPPSNSVQIKDENLEEWEMTNEQKKRQWIKSMASVFTVRKVEVNQTRRSIADETDSLFQDEGNESHNQRKNFKKFVKKNNFIPRTVVIKTTPVPVTISNFARI